MADQVPEKPLRFEQAIDQLETLIEQIETGDVGLEESLSYYERGMSLVGQCKKILTAAELKIAELTPSVDGDLQEQPADPK